MREVRSGSFASASLLRRDVGWNKVRETIFANQKRLGIMPENAKLTPWPKELPEWDSLSVEEKKLFIKQADVYGAYLAYADHEIGRVIQAVEDLGELDNTLIIYIGGDNSRAPKACSTVRRMSAPPDLRLRLSLGVPLHARPMSQLGEKPKSSEISVTSF